MGIKCQIIRDRLAEIKLLSARRSGKPPKEIITRPCRSRLRDFIPRINSLAGDIRTSVGIESDRISCHGSRVLSPMRIKRHVAGDWVGEVELRPSGRGGVPAVESVSAPGDRWLVCIGARSDGLAGAGGTSVGIESDRIGGCRCLIRNPVSIQRRVLVYRLRERELTPTILRCEPSLERITGPGSRRLDGTITLLYALARNI